MRYCGVADGTNLDDRNRMQQSADYFVDKFTDFVI
jgi:hypothetical protein